jgi:site-specific DNA recombinase
MNALRYYRCTGADGYRFSGKAVCHNGPLRGDQLEQAVWDQVGALLEEPHRVAGEYRRRITQARDGAAMPEEIVRLDRQITSLRRGIGRLIDSYTEGVIDKTEFEPRIVGLRQRLSQLQERHQAALEAAETERDLALVISRLEDFSAKVSKASTNWHSGHHPNRRTPGRNRRQPHRGYLPGPTIRWSTGTKITNQNSRFLATLYRR